MHIRNLSMSFGTQELFKDVNLDIDENKKIGLVGVNGAGKSTLFKIIMNIIEPDTGKIILNNNDRIGYLPQIIDDEIPNTDIKVLNFLLLGRPIEKLNNELQSLYDEIAITENEQKQKILFEKIEKIQKKLDYWEYYSAEGTLLKIVDGMNISPELLGQKLCTLSGGQKSKIAFAKLLYSKPEIILLDEPTNHLDKESKDYVTNYLKNYKGSVYIISHDIDFLNKIITKTLFLDKRTKTLELYDGNYDDFKKISTEREKNLVKQAEIQKNEEKKLKSLIDKYKGVSGKRKKMAQDREKKLEKLLENKIEITPVQKKTNITLSMNRESTIVPLRVENICFKYNKENNYNIIDNLSFEISRGEKFLVVGENGVGKSTLLKLIVGILTPDSGNIEIGFKTDIGYYAQEHELLDNQKDIIGNFSDINISQKELRKILGRFLFFGDDVFKPISILSPGERSRVALAKLSLSGANLLVLDEPTNHLDPETQKIIAETFRDFEGTMLVVSHNTEFVNNLSVERILNLSTGTISYYEKEIVEHFEKINSRGKKIKRSR